ncbi:MAG: formate dehydrogenase accessory sulfurtransferase FdhD [Rectinemataceae bacterium]
MNADSPCRFQSLLDQPTYDSRDRLLAPEQTVELEVNGVSFVFLRCTPYDLDVLAIGQLFSSRIIDSVDEVLGLRICPDNSRIRISCVRDFAPDIKARVVSSACGDGPGSIFDHDSIRPLALETVFSLESIRKWAKNMSDKASLYKATGGMHCAALVFEDGSMFTYEDVGRHNAVDKAIGRGLLERADFARCCLISSGRIAVELAEKAIVAGIPLIASRSIPTTAAAALAIDKGLTLIGRIGSVSPIVYTAKARVI